MTRKKKNSPSSQLDTSEPHSDLWLILVGLALILLGFGLTLFFDPNSFIEKLIYGFIVEVGFAFSIAWGVGRTVEKGARKEFNDYVQRSGRVLSQNVFGYLYSVNFPRSAFKVMEDHIFSQPIIKTRQVIEMELIDPEPDSEWVKMRCQFDYTLKNMADTVINHPVRFHASKIAGMDEPPDHEIGLKSLTIGDDQIDPSRFEEIDRSAEDEVGQQKFVEEVVLGPKEEVRVRVTFIQHKRVNDNDLWQSNSVCEGFELNFRYNPDLFDLFLEPVHPSNKFKSDLGPTNGDNCRRVEIEQALLPKNGVFMWWNRKVVK